MNILKVYHYNTCAKTEDEAIASAKEDFISSFAKTQQVLSKYGIAFTEDAFDNIEVKLTKNIHEIIVTVVTNFGEKELSKHCNELWNSLIAQLNSEQ